ncbi:RxLR effector protein [Phytophthora megakarya]|uniref:RxLR effector protein n=1 Tax=Phytophthora megakarya TaxID=4795 RepID=A0A225VX19_9STRA|nr:RxLR effector protein [Phytophthora megakarya]
MLVSRILFTIAAVAVSFDVVSAGRDGDQVSSVIPDNSLAKRFLRTVKAIEEGNAGFGDDKKNDVEDDQERH